MWMGRSIIRCAMTLPRRLIVYWPSSSSPFPDIALARCTYAAVDAGSSTASGLVVPFAMLYRPGPFDRNPPWSYQWGDRDSHVL